LRQPVIFRIFKGDNVVEAKQFDLDQIVIGRGGTVQIDLEDSAVASIHALVELRDSGYYLCDLGSETGTFKNGEQILDEPLSSGDEIRVGPYRIVFMIGVPKPKAPPPRVGMAPAIPATPPPPGKDGKTASAIAGEGTAKPNQPTNLVSNLTRTPENKNASKKPNRAADKYSSDDTQIVPLNKVKVGKPEISKAKIPGGDPHGSRTFAPASDYSDLKDLITPTKGSVVEVVVAWKERVIGTYHFAQRGEVRMGSKPSNQIPMPGSLGTASYRLMSLTNAVVVHSFTEMDVEIYTASQQWGFSELQARQRMIRGTHQGYDIRLEQGEVMHLSWQAGIMNVYIRYVPDTPKPVMAPLFDFSATEATGIVVAFLLMGLMGLYSAIYGPQDEKKDEVEHVATFVYTNKPTPTPRPAPKPTPPPPAPTPPPAAPKPTPPPPPKKINVMDAQKKPVEKKPSEVKVTVNDQSKHNAKTASQSSAASDLRPKPPKVNRPKSFTSIKQGGATKIGETAGANAQSQNKDVTKVGLFAAFGGGGVRKELDKAYSGAGEVLGMGEKATGTSGQSDNRAGDDIGSKFKDTGAGGKGTATQGISGIGTKGRGSGNSGYGSSIGFGDKGNVNVEPGGVEEDFSGTIDREAVRRVVRDNLRDLRSCYERALNQKTGIEGKVVITWEIGEQGRVLKAVTKSSTIGSPFVEDCIRLKIKSWKFPEPPPGTVGVVSFPFVFSSQR
jgi:outer membrane biosynthesis protein TonB/pSer/pThr/pTyr-binding forkhead associated (FHA) protein